LQKLETRHQIQRQMFCGKSKNTFFERHKVYPVKFCNLDIGQL
jgi:hypothetical protein